MQLVKWQTSMHEVVGSSPTRRSTFSNLNIYNSPCACAYGVFQKNTLDTHTRTNTYDVLFYLVFLFCPTDTTCQYNLYRYYVVYMLLFHCYCYLLFTVLTSSLELFVRLLCEINKLKLTIFVDIGK